MGDTNAITLEEVLDCLRDEVRQRRVWKKGHHVGGFGTTPRQNVVLAAMSTQRRGDFGAVQMQILLFLMDEKIAEHIGGKQFKFTPSHYGPYDAAVYQELEALERLGLVHIDRPEDAAERRCRLTDDGLQVGGSILGSMRTPAVHYLGRAATWACKHSLEELVGGICRSYPAMKAYGVFPAEPVSGHESHDRGAIRADDSPRGSPAKVRRGPKDVHVPTARRGKAGTHARRKQPRRTASTETRSSPPDGYLVTVCTPSFRLGREWTCDSDHNRFRFYVVAASNPVEAESIVRGTVSLSGGWIMRVEPAEPGDVRRHELEPGQFTPLDLPLSRARSLDEKLRYAIE